MLFVKMGPLENINDSELALFVEETNLIVPSDRGDM